MAAPAWRPGHRRAGVTEPEPGTSGRALAWPPAAGGAVVEAEAVLLDMDGTVVDSTRVVERLWARFAADHRIDLPELLAFAHGRQTRDTIARFLPAGLDAAVARAAFQSAELQETDGITPVAGAASLLGRLAGARVAIVTSAPAALARARIAAAGLDFHGLLVSGDDVPDGKPDPAGYLRAARLLGAVPARCVAFEDADAGIRAAVSAGARTVVVGSRTSEVARGLRRVPDLTTVGATVSTDRRTVCLELPEEPL